MHGAIKAFDIELYSKMGKARQLCCTSRHLALYSLIQTYCKTVELMLACTYFEPRKEKITKNKEQYVYEISIFYAIASNS